MQSASLSFVKQAVKEEWNPATRLNKHIKGRGAPAFARPEKLTAHTRTVHRNKNAQAICPAAPCPNTASKPDVLWVHTHVEGAHLESGENVVAFCREILALVGMEAL
jgi:hypothetical protein